MSSVIKFTPLSGCYDEGPLCYLLQMDDIYILLDCGWDDRFNVNDAHIQQLKKLVNKIDIVLLSHSDIHHIGALPYLVGQLGLLKQNTTTATTTGANTTTTTAAKEGANTTKTKNTQIFGTLPVCKMGIMTMYDMYQHMNAARDFQVFNLDDVDVAFDSMIQLKYSQRYRYKNDKGTSSLTIVPFNAGHSLGGTVWKIMKETDEIVYAVDYNHRKERHLNGTSFEILGKPSILITDANSALNQTVYNKAHEKRIIQSIVNTLQKGGNVLLPCDTAARSLELALLLESNWRKEPGLAVYPIIFFSTMSFRTVEFASHQLEWMSDDVMKGFDERRENPFSFQYTHVCQDMNEFLKSKKWSSTAPRVVLATSDSLENGFSRELFLNWASDPKNLILFTGRSTAYSLSRQLIQHCMKQQQQQQQQQQPLELQLTNWKRVPLQGQELKDYELQQQKLKEQEKKKLEEEKKKKAQGKVIKIRDEDASDSDSDLDGDDMLDMMSDEDHPHHHRLRSGADYHSVQSRLFLPENMRYHSQYLMFPSIEYYPKSDVFGQWIDVDELKNRALMVYEAEINSYSLQQQQLQQQQQQDHEEESQIIPTKSISEQIHLTVYSRIEFIDFEGRSNAQSVQNILKQLAPRKLLLVHGDEPSTNKLKDYCTNQKISDYVEAPQVNQVLEVSMDTNMFKVKLRQDLLSQVNFVKVGAYELGYVQGEYTMADQYSSKSEELQRLQQQQHVPLGTDEEDLAKLPSIAPLSSSAVHGHNSVFIGDVKLSQFFDILIKNGFKAEFIQGGHLVCNDSVMLKRDGKTGQITLDGAFCADYFRIRSLLYSQYQVL